MAKNIARNGAPKKLQPVTINGGNYHMRNGQMIVGKRLAPVATTPGMRSRTVPDDARLLPRK